MTHTAGTITELWRFPVKSMLGERLDGAELSASGVLGDRAYAIVDAGSGKVASAKHPKQWPDLLRCRARFVEPPQPDAPPPPVLIELPDGRTVRSDAPDADGVLSHFFGREVALASAAPEQFTIDQYHPDQENLNPQGHRDEVVETKLGAALFEEMGLPSAVPDDSFLDLFPISVMTTSTLERLRELRPESRFDVRRFRMNVLVDAPARGFVENDWVGRELAIGDDVTLAVAMPDPRCVMTSVAQEELPRDPEVLRTLGQHNRLELAGGGRYPCAGVYAVVTAPGAIRAGDGVAV